MKKTIRLTESDLNRMIQKVIREQEQPRKHASARRFITETMATAQSLVDDAEEMMASGVKPDPAIKKSVLDCINQEGFTHLAIMTAGAGAYALGLVCAILGVGSGVGAPLGLAASGAILMILEGMGISGEGVADEVNRLVACFDGKR
jgi:hypothetical protein